MNDTESTKAAPRTEIRSTKQIQMTKKQKMVNKPDSDPEFWIFLILDFLWLRFVSVRGASFDIRISDFLSPAFGREKVLDAVRCNILEVKI